MGMLSLSEAIDYIASYFEEIGNKYKIKISYAEKAHFPGVWELSVIVYDDDVDGNRVGYSFSSADLANDPVDSAYLVEKLNVWFKTFFGKSIYDIAREYGENVVGEKGD